MESPFRPETMKALRQLILRNSGDPRIPYVRRSDQHTRLSSELSLSCALGHQCRRQEQIRRRTCPIFAVPAFAIPRGLMSRCRSGMNSAHLCQLVARSISPPNAAQCQTYRNFLENQPRQSGESMLRSTMRFPPITVTVQFLLPLLLAP